MPQHGHRKLFSAKQKKKQLQLKREKKKARDDGRLFVKIQLLALDPIVLFYTCRTGLLSKNLLVHIYHIIIHAFY